MCQLMQMLVSLSMIAIITYIILWTGLTMPTLICADFIKAYEASSRKCRSCWIMQMIEHHHWGMLSAAESIELIMIYLTKLQECVASVKKPAVKNPIFIFSIWRHIFHLNLKSWFAINKDFQMFVNFYMWKCWRCLKNWQDQAFRNICYKMVLLFQELTGYSKCFSLFCVGCLSFLWCFSSSSWHLQLNRSKKIEPKQSHKNSKLSE